LFADIRFKALVRRCASQREAQGLIQDAFFLGQKHWGNNRSLIPLVEWKIADLDPLLDVCLAELRGDNVYIKGAEDHFEWYFKKVEASKKGGDKNAQRLGKVEPIGQPIGQPIGYPSQASPPTPTPTPTLKEEIHTSTSVDPCGKSNQPKKRSKAASVLFDLWNLNCASLAKARGMSAKRSAAEASRLKENHSPDYWLEVISRITASKFCRGEAGSSWRADFDWLLKPDTHLKVLEGKYDDKDGARAEDTPEALNAKYGVKVL
jgi:hypothetical protein